MFCKTLMVVLVARIDCKTHEFAPTLPLVSTRVGSTTHYTNTTDAITS